MSLWQLRARRNRPAPDPRARGALIFGGAGGFGISAVRPALTRAALLGSVSLGVLAMLGPNAVHAQDATWTGSADSNWNNDLNWSPAGAPAGTATFSAAATTSLTFSLTFTAIDTLQFTTTAPAYSYNLFGQALVIGGAGVLNSSSNAPTFNAFGLLEFDNAATAGNAIINNAGATTFTGTSTAENARIANFSGGLLSFTDSSTAGNATILTLSLAKTQFASNSTGGNAQLIAAGGIFDFSLSSGPAGDNKLSAGSIAGIGAYYLGANQLTVGGNNLSTTVNGVISDCGLGGSECNNLGAAGGALVKVGTGTMILGGDNT
jgi:hypothetical protein